MTPSSGAHYRDVMTETDRRHLVHEDSQPRQRLRPKMVPRVVDCWRTVPPGLGGQVASG
jgi:hypothetical protein